MLPTRKAIIAESLGVSERTVARWFTVYRQHGLDARGAAPHLDGLYYFFAHDCQFFSEPY